MRLPRMTTRRWMVVVAISAMVIAASLWVSRALLRAQEYRRLAIVHLAFGNLCFGEAGEYRYAADHSRASDRRDRDELQMIEAHQLKLANYHHDMARKYEHAARYPWLPVEPDPPPPAP